MGFESASCLPGFDSRVRCFMLSLSCSSYRRQMAVVESPAKAINRWVRFTACAVSRSHFNMSWLAGLCGVGKVGNSLEALT